MQVFVPHETYAESVRVLDLKRLGKQRVETYQVILVLLKLQPGMRQEVDKLGQPRVRYDVERDVFVPIMEWDGTFKPRVPRGWRTHPVVVAWKDNLTALFDYQVATVNEWQSRGYKDTCLNKSQHAMRWAFADDHGMDVNDPLCKPEFKEWMRKRDKPWWWGTPEIHASHRAALLYKAPEHYAQFGWTETPAYDYVWPDAKSREASNV